MSLLAAKHLKPSAARADVLKICLSSGTPLDVDSVAQKLNGKVHLATIYRTLERFVSVGLLERVDFQEGKFRYEYMHHHHHHAVCENCGKVEDITESASEIKDIEQRLTKDSGFSVTKHVLELFGLCNKCQMKGSHE